MARISRNLAKGDGEKSGREYSMLVNGKTVKLWANSEEHAIDQACDLWPGLDKELIEINQ